MITKTNKVITISIDIAQGVDHVLEVVVMFVDFATALFKLLGLEVFIDTSDEYYEADDNG